jgi:membrane protein
MIELELGWRGWRALLGRALAEVRNDRIDIIAAGVAFYALLAVGPALAALVAIYGILAEPGDLERLVASVARLTPGVSRTLLIDDMLAPAIAAAPRTLTFGAVGGVVVSLWLANRGMNAVIEAIDIASAIDSEPARRRGWIRQTALSFALLIGAVVLFAVVSFAVIVFPHLFRTTVVGESVAGLFNLLRWPLLFVVFALCLTGLYRWAPVRRNRRASARRWLSTGSIVATILWLGFCGLFSWYSSRFLELGGYGIATGVAAFALWLYGTAYVILLGAELDAELDAQVETELRLAGMPIP